MKTIFFLPLLLLAAQAFGQAKTESDILALSKQKFNFMIESNFDSLADLLADQIFISHIGGRLQTKREYLDDLRNKKFAYKQVDVKQETARIVGSTATIIGRATFLVTANGADHTFDLFYTEVYAMENKKWKMALYSVQRAPQP